MRVRTVSLPSVEVRAFERVHVLVRIPPPFPRVAAAEHPARFFTYWALKEAYIKARGLGLAIPLGAFTFRVDGEGPIGIDLDERITEDPGDWRFDHRWATEVHSLAVAAPRATDELEVHVHPPPSALPAS